MFHLGATVCTKRVPDDGIVAAQELHRSIISQALCQRGRTFHVRKHDRAEPGTDLTGIGWIDDAPQKHLHGATVHWHDVIREHPVGGLVHRARLLRGWRVHQTECRTTVVIEPVGEVLHAELILHGQILRVRLGQLLSGSAGYVVSIHVVGHLASLKCRS